MVDALVKGAWEYDKQIFPDGASSLIEATHRQEIRFRTGESVTITISVTPPHEMADAIFEVRRQGEVLIRKTIGDGIEIVPNGIKVNVDPNDTENHPLGPGWSWDLTMIATDTSQNEIKADNVHEPIVGSIELSEFTMENFSRIKSGWIAKSNNGTNAIVMSTIFPWVFVRGSLKTRGSNIGTVRFIPIIRSVVAGGPWVCRAD